MSRYTNFLKYLFRDDTTWTLLGVKGTGKTNTASVIIKESIERSIPVFTNIHFFSKEQISLAIQHDKLPKRRDDKVYIQIPPEVHVCSKLSEVLYGLCDPGPKLTILDEAGIHADSSSAMSTSTKTVKNLNKIIRHFDSSFGLITQTKGSIPPDLRERNIDVELTVVLKGEQRFLECGKREAKRDESGEWIIEFPVIDKFGPIPLSQYPFDGKFPSGFDIDIDLKEALDRLSEERSTLDIIEGGKGKIILDELKKKDKKKKKK